MKSLTNTLLILMISTFVNLVSAQNLKLNTEQSNINWTGKAAFNTYSLTGSLKTIEGSIKIENGEIVVLNVIIDMKSLDHNDTNLRTHLRSKDFFEVEKYIKSSFKLVKPAKIKNNKVILIGEITIKDITKDETITATFINKSLSFEHIMDRTIYGVKFNSPSFFKKIKENAIADEFTLKGNLFFN